jgi:DNA-binding transcriptional regulator YiaG
MNAIGATIKQKRLKPEISQAALTKRLNVRVENVQNWEHSRTIPDICYLPRIIDFLEYDPLKNDKKSV